jgi:hypothetical protein
MLRLANRGEALEVRIFVAVFCARTRRFGNGRVYSLPAKTIPTVGREDLPATGLSIDLLEVRDVSESSGLAWIAFGASIAGLAAPLHGRSRGERANGAGLT